ncbi:MAG: AfsR/SARP family transcriptional regulator, partial [Actinobacteria bacterium]|nr:AfsR/SARP family transcriptional regulator [Actinomycetota bacterium]
MPLSCPEVDESDMGMKTAAVRLFVARAAVTRRGFTLSAEVAPAVGEICRRLDGSPLAIELAAARVDVLTPAEMVDRLDDRFGLLDGAALPSRDRRNTLEGAIGWSYNLLNEPERAVLRRLSIFMGWCTLEAVESVCADGARGLNSAFEPLAALVARSLVIADTTGSHARYRLLDSIRAYGAERLSESGELATFRRRHAAHFVAFAERLEPRLTSSEQQMALDGLEGDHDNLKTAFDWALASRDAEMALRLSGALTIFWRVRCYFREGRQWLESALRLADTAKVNEGRRARALWGAGFMAMMLHDEEAAVPLLDESLSLLEQIDDIGGQARSLLLLGNVSMNRDTEAALRHLIRSEALARRSKDAWCLAHALGL